MSSYPNFKLFNFYGSAVFVVCSLMCKKIAVNFLHDFAVIDALVVAMDVLYYKLRDDKEFSGRILFFSNFRSRFSTHQLNKICNAIKVRKMELNFM